MQYFSVFDKVNSTHSRLIPAPNEASFFRYLGDCPQDSIWRKHPEDFSVYFVLDFNEDNAAVKSGSIVCLVNSLVPVFSKGVDHE